ncbi:MAG: FecR domain-containing protein [Flavitalea sp.]
MDKTSQFSLLLEKFRNGTASKAELTELLTILNDEQFENNTATENLLSEIWQKIPDTPQVFDEGKSEMLLHNVMNAPASVVPMRRSNLRRVIAVAAILIILVGGYFLIPAPKQPSGSPLALNKPAQSSPILPGTNKAELILDDGTSVALDSLNNGRIAEQSGVQVRNVDGKIVYTRGSKTAPIISYNTLRTPKGGFYQLTLSDGSKLWLNAASSIRYPVVFSEKERVVELNGEAYFEVAKDSKRPFTVKTDDMDVQVLGTHFNVMAYNNESAVKATLLEGSVKIRAAGNNALLTPGQQAKLNSSNKNLEVISNVNVEEVVAWKNGYFQFERVGTAELMRQIERWYDVEVKFDGPVQPRAFGGKIARSSNLENVLKILEWSKISFTVENKTITVKHTN